MNSLVTSVLATGAVAAIVVATVGLPEVGPGVGRDEITGSIAQLRSDGYMLSRDGVDACIIRPGAQMAPSVYQLIIPDSCLATFGHPEGPTYWTETGGGGIVISGRNGTIVEFAEADGIGFESVVPASPLYSLRSVAE